jgi:hypothetical protein
MKGWKRSVVWLLLVGWLLSGCDRWVEVGSGLYVPRVSFPPVGATETGASRPEIADSGVETVFVDREHQVVWITFDDGTVDVVPFVARPREAWPSGCPTNVNATRMEVLSLEVEAVALASVVIEHPILVRDCPPDPQELVLRDSGEAATTTIGGAGTACSGAETCVILTPRAGTLSLSHSMKGYALYSWPVEGDPGWRYTLRTGTNRTPTWEEISAPENTLTDEGWVKITVDGETALKSLLDRLPAGEVVVWIGPDAPQATPIVAAHVALPDPSRVREIQTYSDRIEIDMRVTLDHP